MPKHHFESQYFADDKDIFDLFESSRNRFSAKRLTMLARERGLFVSPETDRAEIVRMLSRLTYSSKQLEELLHVIDSTGHDDKKTIAAVEGREYCLSDAMKAAEEARDSRTTAEQEAYKITQFTGGTTLEVSVEYSEMNFAKNRLKQRRPKSGTIEFVKTDTGFDVRHDDNPRMYKIVEEILTRLPSEEHPSLHTSRIELDGINDPNTRTAFFIELMNGISGFNLDSVLDVKVTRLSSVVDESDDDIHEDDTEAEEAQVVGIVNEVAMKGVRLMESAEYKSLVGDNFFVSKAIWRSRSSSSTEQDVVFEAGFSEPNKGTGFNYDVKTIYDPKKGGGLRSSSRKPSPSESRILMKELEASARKAMTAALSYFTDEEETQHQEEEEQDAL